MWARELRPELKRLCRLIAPERRSLDRKFQARLTRAGYDATARRALTAMTLGAASVLAPAGARLSAYIEQVSYNARRLAKMNVASAAVISALAGYDTLLDACLRRSAPDEFARLRRAREQLAFDAALAINQAFYEVREAEAQAFFDLFRAELQASSLDTLLETFASTLARYCRAQDCRIRLLDATPAVFRRARYFETPRPGQLLDSGWRRKFGSFWSIPMQSPSGVGGVMQLAFRRSYRWLPRELELLHAAAERCLAAAEKARLAERLSASERKLRELSAHMLGVEEEERRRIRRELHDDTGQSLLLIRLELEMLESRAPAEIGGRLAAVRGMTERTIAELRRIIAALSPAVLEQLGLYAAIRQLAARFRRVHPARIGLRLEKLPGRLPKQIEEIAYRLVQECLNNVAKHSQASAVKIRMRSADKGVELSVEDNGVGFEPVAAALRPESFGLAGMRERVALLGGDFQIRSGPDRGTTVRVRLPA